jgi:hypothetical protein
MRSCLDVQVGPGFIAMSKDRILKVCVSVGSTNNNKTFVGRDATTSKILTSRRRAFARNVEFLHVFSGSCALPTKVLLLSKDSLYIFYWALV